MLAIADQYQPFWIWPAAFGAIAAIAGFFWLLTRVIEHFFPSTKKKRYGTAMGNALMRVDAVLLPQREHIIEAREWEETEENERSEPPERGGTR